VSAVVVGEGSLAETLRTRISTDVPARVIVPPLVIEPRRVVDLTDDDIDRVWERPMRTVITELQRAHSDGCRRIVVVVPTTGQSGGSEHAAMSATAEAARVLVKSAARQWGAAGVTVNAVALAPEAFGVDTSITGPVSIAPRALEGDVDPIPTISFLCSDAAGHVTGQTIVCDGGLWM
jgi:3-oxoacyl-[acyl-carrier protein] reductase